jgi:hypothetical protein
MEEIKMKLEELLILMEEDKPKPMPPKKYRAIAYVDRCLHQVSDGIENDDWDLIADFIGRSLSEGSTVVITDNTTNETKTLYPENLIEGGIE